MIRIKLDESIYTVFPKDDNFLPQDFDTMQKAKAYAKEIKDEFDVDSTIEGAEGVLETLGEANNDVLAKGRDEYRTKSANKLYSMISNPNEFTKKLDVFRKYVPSPDRAIPFPLARELAIPLRKSGKLDEIEYWCDMDEEGLVWLASRSKDAKDFVNNFLDSAYNAGVDNPLFFETIIDAIMSV